MHKLPTAFASLSTVALLLSVVLIVSGCGDDASGGDAGRVDARVLDSGPADAGDSALPDSGLDGGPATPAGPLPVTEQWGQELGLVAGSVSLDGTDRIAGAGKYNGAADLGGGALPLPPVDPESGLSEGHGWVAAWNSDGSYRWHRVFPENELQLDVVAESGGATIIAGGYWGSVDFGLGTRASVDGEDGFIVRYLSDGTPDWQLFVTASSGFQVLRAIARDGDDNIYVVGQAQSSSGIDFGGGSRVPASPTVGLIASYDSTGAHRWDALIDVTDVLDVVFASGVVVITGVSGGAGGAFLEGRSPTDGSVTFRRDFVLGDATPPDFAPPEINLGRLAADASGNIYAVGTFFSSAVDFGGGERAPYVPIMPCPCGTMVVLQVDGSGAWQWDRTYAPAEARSFFVDGSDHPIIFGGVFPDDPMSSGIDLGGGRHTYGDDPFSPFGLRLTPEGAYSWDAASDGGNFVAATDGDWIGITNDVAHPFPARLVRLRP